MTIYTIGHSTRTLEEFLAVLQAHGIQTLCDIRAYPASRRMPWFQGPQHPPFMTDEEAVRNEALETTLPRAGIAYVWLRGLGGRRRKASAQSPHTALRSDAFVSYADYMLTAEFRKAIDELLSHAQRERTAMMCAEAQVYWSCHRMLVSDYLVAHGYEVLHIATAASPKAHKMTDVARITEQGVIYDGGMLF